MTYRGGCHCGRIAFEVDGPIAGASECNCSICAKKAYIHWIVAPERFRLLTPRENLTTYTFNTHTAKHYFCAVCGVAPFYIPRSDPDKIDVNVRCLEGVDIAKLEVGFFDGQHWEQALANERKLASKS
jgi:hypothetical protein